jgi:hypothetical protein
MRVVAKKASFRLFIVIHLYVCPRCAERQNSRCYDAPGLCWRQVGSYVSTFPPTRVQRLRVALAGHGSLFPQLLARVMGKVVVVDYSGARSWIAMSDYDKPLIICPKCQRQAVFSGAILDWGKIISSPCRDPRRTHLEQISPYNRIYFSWQRSIPGWVHCTCSVPFRHDLDWPEEAWFKVKVHGRILWALNRADALHILSFVCSTNRKGEAVSRYHVIRKLPRYFQLASHRRIICRKFEALLTKGFSRKKGIG